MTPLRLGRAVLGLAVIAMGGLLLITGSVHRLLAALLTVAGLLLVVAAITLSRRS
ncbi:hypothetical protein [Aeromicrobium piscarium]|uniref:hypothetical protein n=1 Tax=Aeromicrobium piscarium TaxID=2590901 RepID=UPI00163D5EA4|nr:hypothetical protein [Aeromicrobium piscarium]